MDTIKKVYRIEHNGIGPYQNMELPPIEDIWPWEHKTRQTISRKRPIPYEDGICEFEYGVHVCAFPSMKALRKWFTKNAIKTLHEVGYKVAVYEVSNDNILYGKWQIAIPRGLKPVNIKPLRRVA
jgi:hypothetical protein